MAEVYIDLLTLENFGPFYGEHTLDFRSLEGKCGILVGGKTGAGKTHMLRALYLAVVGESGVGDLKKSRPVQTLRDLPSKSRSIGGHWPKVKIRCALKLSSVFVMTKWVAGKSNSFAKSGFAPIRRRCGNTTPYALILQVESKTSKLSINCGTLFCHDT